MSKVICVIDKAVKKNSGLRKEHGVSFWIETEYGNVIFDTGQTAEVLNNNLSLLGLDPKYLGALALSHAHFDHTGGIETILANTDKIPLYANTDVFRDRYFLRDGEYKKIGFEFDSKYYIESADVKLSDNLAEIFPNLWTTGAIKIRDWPEGGDAHYVLENGDYKKDPFKDDMSLVLRTAEGLVLICGCCHAGLLNTLAQIKEQFSESVCAIIGGTHLMTADSDLLNFVVDMLEKDYSNLRLFLNHCTGKEALRRLRQSFGKRLQHFSAGSSVAFMD